MKPSTPRPSVHWPWLHGAQELSKEASRNDGNKWTKSCMTLRTLNYGNDGIFLIMGSAGFCPSTILLPGIQKPTVFGGGSRFRAFKVQESGFGGFGASPCTFLKGTIVNPRKLEH